LLNKVNVSDAGLSRMAVGALLERVGRMVRLPPDQRAPLTNVRRKIEESRGDGVVSAACGGLLEVATTTANRDDALH
jgi:hypothetical protein